MSKITDEAIMDAIREQMLARIKSQNDARTVNYMLGGGQSGAKGGVFETLGAPSASPVTPDEDPDLDYFVDILKNDNIDPETGKSIGWKKKVHRYASPRGETPPTPKKKRMKP